MVVCMDCGRILSHLYPQETIRRDPSECPGCNPEPPEADEGDREQVDQEHALFPWLDADTGDAEE